MIALVIEAHAPSGRLVRTSDAAELQRQFVAGFIEQAGVDVGCCSFITEAGEAAAAPKAHTCVIGTEQSLAFGPGRADLIVIREDHRRQRPEEAALLPDDQAIMSALFDGRRAVVSAAARFPGDESRRDGNTYWVFVSADGSGSYEGGCHPESDYTRILRRLVGQQAAPGVVEACRPDRTGTGTVSTFAEQLRFNIARHVPLVTTKRVNPINVIEELLFFLRGDTNSQALEARGVNIWRANTTREFLDGRGLAGYSVGDMGPMYGYQWRHFGAPWPSRDGGVDQLAAVERMLKTDPYSRRIVMTTYNPADLDRMVLPPCHGLVVQFYVSLDPADGSHMLSCHMYQRSVDVGLGLVWNIFSYSVLTHLLAKRCDMRPHELIISTGDTHLYRNHVEPCARQLQRDYRCAPVLRVDDSVKDKAWEDLSADDFHVCGYYPHPFIRMDMAV